MKSILSFLRVTLNFRLFSLCYRFVHSCVFHPFDLYHSNDKNLILWTLQKRSLTQLLAQTHTHTHSHSFHHFLDHVKTLGVWSRYRLFIRACISEQTKTERCTMRCDCLFVIVDFRQAKLLTFIAKLVFATPSKHFPTIQNLLTISKITHKWSLLFILSDSMAFVTMFRLCHAFVSTNRKWKSNKLHHQ